MVFLRNTAALCLLFCLAPLSKGAPPHEQETGPTELLPSFSAEVLFPDSLLTSLEHEENQRQHAHKKLVQQLLREIKAIESGKKSLDAANRFGQTSLMLAAQLSERLVVCYLIATGADASLKDRSGRTALDYATDARTRDLLRACLDEASPLSYDDRVALVELAGHSSDEQQARLWDSVNYPANVNEVAHLLKFGISPVGYRQGRLIIESPFLQPECLAWLVRQGYDVNVRTIDGKSPYCSITQKDIIRLLLALGLQPDAADTAQRTLLWRLLDTNTTLAPAQDTAPEADAPLPRVDVYFDRARRTELPKDQQHNSLGASGQLFTGRMELWDENGECVVTQDVQTGGWMSLNSPFRRMGNYPRNAHRRAYDPLQFPDTAFPLLTEETCVETLQTTALCGYSIPDPPGTGRTGLMIHSSERLGSEGCISASVGVKWAIFSEKMEHFRDMGHESIPLRVFYLCSPPDPQRSALPTPAAPAAAPLNGLPAPKKPRRRRR